MSPLVPLPNRDGEDLRGEESGDDGAIRDIPCEPWGGDEYEHIMDPHLTLAYLLTCLLAYLLALLAYSLAYLLTY